MMISGLCRNTLVLLALAACSQAPTEAVTRSQTEVHDSLFSAEPGQQWRLPSQLREISGLATTADGRLFAHDDERARVYEIDPRAGTVVKSFAVGEPAARGDFEGLAITPSGDFWMATSGGALLRFREGDDGAHVAFERHESGLNGVCEIEGLAYLASDESLILACKSHEARDMRETIALYQWTPDAASARLWRTLPEARVTEAAGVRRFRPSSIEFDTRTGAIILVSGNQPALAELSADGALISARDLRGAHRQPESAAILSNGDLVIADEGGDGRALLTLYGRIDD